MLLMKLFVLVIKILMFVELDLINQLFNLSSVLHLNDIHCHKKVN